MDIVLDLILVALLALLGGVGNLDKNKRRIVGVLALILVIVYPLFFNKIDGSISDATQYAAYVVMGLGLNVVVGYAGLLDLGYVAFFAVGAYSSGWFMSGFYASTNHHLFVSGIAEHNQLGLHFNFLIVVIIGMVFCAIAGMIIGLPTLRLRGDYIAIVTLAFGEIIHTIAVNGDTLHPLGKNYPITAGRQGITPVDQIGDSLSWIPGAGHFSSYTNLRPYYWTALGLALIALFISLRLRDSRLGRAWIAIREDEVAAASMGIPLVKTKLQSYAIGAALGGMSGVFLGPFLQTVNADSFAFSFSIFILAMIILGGLGSVWGVVIGSIVLTYINYTLIPDKLDSLPGKLGLHFNLTDLSFGIFGFLLVIMMIIRPQGLLPEMRHKLELEEGIGATETSFEVRA